MAAVLKRIEPLSYALATHANDLAERRALADVMGVVDNVQTTDDEIWMMSYMDIMTLLLTLFVLLLAYSKFTPPPTQTALRPMALAHASPHGAQVVKPVVPATTMSSTPVPHFAVIKLPKPIAQFVGTTAIPIQIIRETKNIPPPLLTAFAMGIQDTVGILMPPLQITANSATLVSQDTASVPAPSAREILLNKIQASPLGKRIELTANQDNVNLEISDNILFDPGSATLKPHGESLLNELAAFLTAQDYTVSIEGHSDDVPFRSAQFASNWELSATRATNVTRYLIAHGIAASRLRAIGYADTRPRAENASAEGRARNRRVSLVLHMPAPVAPNAIAATP